MVNMLIWRDEVARTLSECLHSGQHGLRNVPGLVCKALEVEAWKERIVGEWKGREVRAKFPTCRAWIEARVPEGLGATVELLARMLADDPQALEMFRRATELEPGDNQYTVVHDNVMHHKAVQGNSRAYTLVRLKRDWPDLFEQVVAGKISANAAAIEAGFRTRATPLDKLRSAWDRASPRERRTFLAEINTAVR